MKLTRRQIDEHRNNIVQCAQDLYYMGSGYEWKPPFFSSFPWELVKAIFI